MRTKSFILTFLMMMFCSIGFGQSGTGNHWNPDEHQYANNMDVIAIIEIDDVEQKTESLEVGAFCGTELRASSRPMKAPMLENRYIVFLDILGDDDDDLITFKLYDHSQGIELNYVIEKPINFRFGQDPLGSVDAPYVLEFLTPVAKIGDVHYRTLPLAVEAATAGQTVELVADATGAGVVINKDVTIDFGGFTYTVNQAVGSAGTESQGFQLLKNNTVTLQNGYIAIAENTNVKWMFNAYANVTLAGLNVNCTNMATPAANEANYVLVVNNGGGATPTVTYNGVNYSNFPGSNAPLYVDPSTELVAEAGLNVETDKGYVVEYADNAYTAVAAVAKIGDVYYRTLPLAVEAATAGQTVELIADATGAGLKINKDITVDFGGKTYTINQAVGSTGTESQGFQLLKNNTVTLKNGNIAIAENTNVKWMFNAYANVTLAGLNVNCTNMAAPAENEANYVLVVNNGGGATPTVNYSGVNVTNFPTTEQIWLDPTTTFKAVAGLEDLIETEEGYVVVYNNGEYTAVPAVAKIGDVYYRTLPLAVEAATAGQTVELVADATGAGLVINKNITVDFGGKTYTINQAVGSTGTESQGFQLLKNNTVTLKNGNIAIAENTNVKWMFNAYANVTLAGLNVNCTNMATPAANEANYVLVVNNGGGATPTVNYNGVNVTSFPTTEQIWLDPTTTFKAVAGLENSIKTEAGYVVVYNNGEYTAVPAVASITANEVTRYYATLQAAVEAAQAGETVTLLINATGAGVVIDKNVTIDFGGNIYTVNQAVGSAGTETLGFQILKNKTVTLNNGTLTSTAAVEGSKEVKMLIQNYAHLTLNKMNLVDNTDHILYALSNNSGNVNLVGNTNITTDAVAFDVYDYTAGGYAVPTVNVNTTGIIKGEIEVSSTIPTNLNISGGLFQAQIAEAWCADGYIPTTKVVGEITYYTVKEGEYVARNTTTGQGYETLVEAVEAAQAGETVTLLINATGAGVVIDKNITVDFGGKTYTINQAVGSSGTETLGFQILKNNNVTLKNGTLTSTTPVVAGKEVKMLIQNYANLTLTDMNLDDATEHIQYVLSNNSGISYIKGATNITTDKVAFDVYDYTAGGYTVPTVNVETTGIIKGAIEVSSTATLNIKDGSFTTPIQEAWCLEGYIPTTEVVDGTTYNTVKEGEYVARNTTTGQGYETLVEAVEAAEAGKTITLLKDVTGAGVVINKNITIDFGGYTYSFNEGVGSGSLTSNGFQLLQGNDVVLKNGGLKVAETAKAKFYILVQNYADLTIEDMNLDGTNLDKWSATDGDSYVLSNNSGEVKITGATNITANDEGNKAFAFDVCKYASYTEPIVNVNTTGVIAGDIEVTTTQQTNLNISGGLFTAQIAEAWCADGYIPTTEVVDGITYYTVKEGEYVAQIGEDKYEKFAAAIAAVNNGETITLLTDNAESVTIKQVAGKSFTIDGAGKTYKGTINVDGNRRSTGTETLTIKNVNFLAEGQWQSSIFAVKNTYVHNVTIDGCTFTGNDAKQAYGIRLHHSYNIVVKNTTGNKLYDLVYAQTVITGFTAENVTVTESGMGFMMPYGKNLSFKNVTLNVEGAGVGIYNYNASTATFENCKFTAYPPVHLEQMNATNAYSLTFNGTNNTFAGSDEWLEVIGTDAKFTVTLNDPSLDVHKTSGLIAGVGNVYYNTFDYALAQAKSTQEEDAVKILKTVILSADQTIDFENIAVTSTVNPAFRITDGATVTVENGNMNTEDGGYNFILGASDGSSTGNLTIKSGKYHASTTVASVTKGNLVIEGGEFSATPYNGDCRFLINCIDGNYINNTAKVSIIGGTFHKFNPENNLAEGADTNFCPEGYIAVYDAVNDTYTVRKAVYVAQVNDGAKYESLVEAVAAAEDNDVVKLLDNATGAGLVINKDITVDFGGFTYTINQAVGSTGTETQGFQLLPSAENVILKNGIINVDGANVIWMINDYAKNLTVEGMTFNCSGMNLEHSAVMGLVINNLNNTDPKVVFGANVIFNGLTTSILLEHDTQLTAGEGWMNAIEPEDGYVVVYKEGVYTVARPVASITREGVTTEYATLGDATSAAVTGDVVNLLCDVNGGEVTVDLQVAKKITVDLGGHKYTSTGTAFIAYRAGTELTLTNGTVHGNGAAGATLRTTYKATLTLGDNLTVTAGPQALAILVQDGKFFVNPNTDNVIVNGGIDCIKVQENALEVSIASGTYTEDVQEWCAQGYVSQDNGDGTWTVRAADYVAEIVGGAKYESLQAAIDAAVDGQTVTLLKDINYTFEDTKTTPEGQPILVDVTGKYITLDFAGKKISVNHQSTTDRIYAVVFVADGAGLTVTGNGFIDVDVSDNTPKVAYMFWKRGTTGHLTIENGNFHMDNSEDSMVYTNGDEIVTVNGGTFTLDMVGTRANGFPCIFNATGQNAQKIIVNDGTFNADVNHQFWANEVYVPETLALKNNGNGTWTVVDAVAYVVEKATSTNARNRNVGYATLAEAVNPLGNPVDNTVTVIKSHELAETVIVNKNVNIDFAEKDIEGSLTPAIRIQGGANVTIKNGKMNTTGYNFILGASDGTSAGNLTIESGEYHAQTSVVSVTKGHLNITGGDFSVEPYQGNYAYLINCIDANYNNETATVAISGGTFHNWNPQNNAAEGAGTNFCASGYGAVEKSTGVWEVVPMQGMKISAGWNWFSSYIDINGEAGLVKLQDALNPYGVQIKGNGGFTQYTEGQGWFGTTLTSVSVKEMYMINMTEDHELQLKGKLVDPDQNAITLEHGWNWIGYQLNQELDLNDALSKLSANNGDFIKTHNGIAQYIQGYGWWGTLTTMKPGVGYMYDNISADDNTLVYSYPEEGAKTELRTNVTSDNNRWVPVSYKYAHNMNIIAVVEGMESENYEVAAFVGGEVRGSARPIYVEPLDANIVFLTIYGDDVEEMTFKCYDLATGEEYDLNNRMNYSDDAVVGSINNPYLLSRGTTGIGESALTEVNIYPNPTTTGSEVNLGSVCDTVEVFNALGVKIAEYTNVDTIDALETAGIYVIRITNDGNVQNCRLIVK